MILRSFWDADPRFLDTFTKRTRERLLQTIGKSSFDPNTQYVCLLQYTSALSMYSVYEFGDKIIRGVAIVEALTAATGAEGPAHAFAWFETMYQADTAKRILQQIRVRSTSVHGIVSPHGSLVPATSRALNNEVTCMMFRALHLESDVRLVGLRGAAHLNGKEGVIHGMDLADHTRWRIRQHMC
jgi:hypothetical protein